MILTTDIPAQTLFVWLAFGFGSLVLSAVIIVLIRRWRRVLDMLDIPNHRSSHVQATPRGAGIAIVACVVLGAASFAALAPNHTWQPWLIY